MQTFYNLTALTASDLLQVTYCKWLTPADLLQQVGERHGGRQPRGECEGELCVVDGGQARLQALAGRVPAPRVLVLSGRGFEPYFGQIIYYRVAT